MSTAPAVNLAGLQGGELDREAPLSSPKGYAASPSEAFRTVSPRTRVNKGLLWLRPGLPSISVIAAGGIMAPRSYRFLKYLAIGRRTWPAFSYVRRGMPKVSSRLD